MTTSFISNIFPLTGLGAVRYLTLILKGCLNEPAFYELTTGSNNKL